MESGINFRPIDYAKLGSMMINNGMWNGNRVVSEKWIKTSTVVEFPIDNAEYQESFLAERNTGYKYMWYSTLNSDGYIDYFAAGKYGQFIYVSSSNDVVIIRTGIDAGGIEWWPDLLKSVANEIGVKKE